MKAEVQDQVQDSEAEAGVETSHYFCCDEDLSLCGVDLSEHNLNMEEDTTDCVVCLEIPVCPVCGYVFPPL